MGGAKKILISHVSPDHAAAQALVEALEARGFDAARDVDAEPIDRSRTRAELLARVEGVEMVVLLVSPDYLAATRSFDVDLLAMERFGEGTARVVPVLIRDCAWRGALFSSLLAERLSWRRHPDAPRDAEEIAAEEIARTFFTSASASPRPPLGRRYAYSEPAALRSRYAESLDAVRRSLQRLDGFSLQPVVCDDLRLAYVLADYLRSRRMAVRMLAPQSGDWSVLFDSLLGNRLAAKAGRRALIVFGRGADAPALAPALARLNQKRDRLGDALDCPLLWCGPTDFLDACGEAMPDFWSVRGLALRLTPRRRAPRGGFNAVPHWRRLWLGLEHREALARARSLAADAARLDDPNLIRAGALRLGAALGAAGAFDEAAATVTEGLGTLQFATADLGEFVVLAARLAVLRERSHEAVDILTTWNPRLTQPTDFTSLDGLEALCAAHLQLGDVALASSLLDEAEQRAARTSPEPVALRVNLLFDRGLCDVLRGDTTRAVQRWQEALALNATRGGADPAREAALHLALGDALGGADQFDRAAESLRRAASLFATGGDRAGAEEAERALLPIQRLETRMPTPVQIRDELVDVLRRDLVGPLDTHEAEVLPQPPSRWYLTGFLIPYEAPESQRYDAEGQETLDVGGDDGGAAGDDAAAPEDASARRAFFPSSLGVSVLLPADATALTVTVTWADYRAEGAADDGDADAEPTDAKPDGKRERDERWRRVPHAETFTVPVGKRGRQSHDVPASHGLRLVVSVRPVRTPAAAKHALVPAGTRAVSVFLVNHRVPRDDQRRDEGFVFQARLVVQCERPFVPRPDLRGRHADDPDEQVADLQHRDVFEYAVGHGVATRALCDDPRTCHAVETAWVPSAEVEKVVPGTIPGAAVTLGMESLAALPDAAAVRDAVGGLTRAYADWIASQHGAVTDPAWRAAVAKALLDGAEGVRARIDDGLALLDDPDALRAFRAMNKAMARAARQRTPERYTKPGSEPTWFPFQLAFVLMNLRGVASPDHPDRRMVDLLFFPTGGGKTEAYLGLAAFTLLLRRRRHPGVSSAGVSVLMRYTLRLLTLDQLGRAAALVCALELERRADPATWGPWPFEIGLWVGKGATPNDMGEKGDNRDDTARALTLAYKNDTKKPSPIPLESCPWCGTAFSAGSFRLEPREDKPAHLRVACVSRKRGPDACPFTGNDALPIVAVDQPLYRRLPCFLIATVDKFANLPWVGRTGALFGRVDRFDAEGFYGPCDPNRGAPLDGPLPPPDLIIQDELHLISGPLGTMVGLHETALDWLCTRGPGSPGPKIVASTATVRRAQHQIQALFARPRVEVFPPPGPDRRDSFFARTAPTSERHARRYVGVAAQGRSLKVVLLRVYIALLSAAQKRYDEARALGATPNPADPYMSLLGYFNSLRELGGSRRIVEDEVTSRLRVYDRRRRVGERDAPFAARSLGEVVELTSRETTARVSLAKHRLAQPFAAPDRVDVALATNMISVGLDITRLGLMVVLGQPKMAAEYIQATSRVGRDDARPGLVVALLNVHRPRDRSHYERFEAWHASFYRAVEATSVTPFSPRAVDRGIAAVAVALARHGLPALTPPAGAVEMRARRTEADFVLDVVGDRAAAHCALPPAEGDALRAKLRGRVHDLLDAWAKIAATQHDAGAGLEYQREVKKGGRLLRDPLDPDLAACTGDERKFRARRSLRDVEPQVKLWVKRLDGAELDVEEGP